MRHLFKAVVLLLSCLLIWSGWLHILNPVEFQNSVAKYNITNNVSTTVLAMFLPGSMIVVGLLLLFNHFPTVAKFLGAGLFAMFSAAQAIAIINGLVIPCGCFGPSDHQVSFLYAGLWCGAAVFLCLMGLFDMRHQPTIPSAGKTNERLQG